MKKTLILLASILALLGVGNATFACVDIDFGSDSVCVDIIKNDDTEFELDVDHGDYDNYPSNAYYYVLLPNYQDGSNSKGGGMLTPRLQGLNMEFDYDYTDYDYNSETRKIKVYAIIDNEVESAEVYYDFDNGERADESDNDNNNTSNGDLDNFYITLSDSTPAEDDEVTLNIKARDNDDDTISDYDGSPADITIEYRTSSSSSRRDASSTQVSIYDETPNFDNGEAETDITFKYEYEYRITVTDEDEDIYDYKIFDVGGTSSSSSNNGDLDNFYITLSDSTPDEDDEVTLNIEARDNDNSTLTNYDGSPADITIEYRTSSSSSRRDATSTQVSIDDKTPTFDNGIAETDVTFKYEYEYGITVTDDSEDIDDYKIFAVGGSSSSNGDTDNFYLSTNDSSPDTNQRVNLTIKARDGTSVDTSYDNGVEFEIYYRSSSSSSRTKTTSSYYYEIDSDYEDGYDFTSSNDGQKTLSNFIRFKKNYEFKVVVIDKDDEDIDGYITYDIRNTDSTVDGFTVRELDYVKTIYNSRTRLFNSFKSSYSNLRSDEDRIDMSNDLYDNMKDVIDDNDSREFETYEDYYNALMDRYTYTIDNKY